MDLKACEFGCRGSKDKVGVLLAQLGTPDAPEPRALRRYLRQFLSDRRVIEVNRVLWWVLLNCVILVTRPRRSSKLYKRIWGKDGSPLLTITKKQADGVRERLSRISPHVEVEFGMRYGKPSLESAVDALIAKGCSKILLFPMYPQYAAATSASTYDAVFSHILKRRWVPTLRVAEPYYQHPRYIAAQAEVINQYLAKLPWKPEYLVLSYHGVPQKYVTKGDPYCCQCVETTAALKPKLDFPVERVVHTFQSRFGRDPWLTPYTDETFEELGHSGVKSIAVVAPGFTADCLETLDELGNEGLEQFEECGGEQYSVIPCLNDHTVWLDSLSAIIKEELGSWLEGEARQQHGCSIQCPLRGEPLKFDALKQVA
jgi:ferrochelatase